MEDSKKILVELTLEEKASLASGKTFWTTKPIERLGVPSALMTDGPHGLRKEQGAEEEKGLTNVMKGSEKATCFPTAVTTASTWDPELLARVGQAIGEEAKDQGVSTVLGPGTNIKRSPLCGRNFEYFSEDPFLAGEMSTAYVNGMQKIGVGCSLKHYCGNNQEYFRMSIDSLIDERALREIYLPAFENTVKRAQPWQVMCSYNKLNGEYLSDNKRMLTDILRKEWNFKGIVVSDWGATNDRVEGVRAGMDLQMPTCKGADD
ncbi:MAG: glycoside hydrolase family 3 protein, partial [Clostridia bacterium]|nr:glycoside hydrolase family 3 protein [Clostridia bacterium]